MIEISIYTLNAFLGVLLIVIGIGYYVILKKYTNVDDALKFLGGIMVLFGIAILVAPYVIEFLSQNIKLIV